MRIDILACRAAGSPRAARPTAVMRPGPPVVTNLAEFWCSTSSRCRSSNTHSPIRRHGPAEATGAQNPLVIRPKMASEAFSTRHLSVTPSASAAMADRGQFAVGGHNATDFLRPSTAVRGGARRTASAGAYTAAVARDDHQRAAQGTRLRPTPPAERRPLPARRLSRSTVTAIRRPARRARSVVAPTRRCQRVRRSAGNTTLG